MKGTTNDLLEFKTEGVTCASGPLRLGRGGEGSGGERRGTILRLQKELNVKPKIPEYILSWYHEMEAAVVYILSIFTSQMIIV